MDADISGRIQGRRVRRRILLAASRGLSGSVLFFLTVLAVIFLAQLFGVMFDTVVSPSMEPEIPVGSLVVTVPAEFSGIEIGDDVTYWLGGSKVTHRVIGKDPKTEFLYTQGLANRQPDGAVSARQLAGRVALHVPLVGYGFLLLADVPGKIFLALVLGILLLLSALLERAAKRNDFNEKEKYQEVLL